MLNKLVKYDLKWINKSMVVFYAIALIICIITRVVSYYTDSFVMNIIYLILKGCTYACFANVLINCIIRIWTRFNHNLYKDESYLTHTIPVTKKTLYNSKIISGFISLAISLLVVGVCIAIVYLNNETIEQIKNIFSNDRVTFIFISVIITAILEVVYIALCGIVGLLIGHRFNNKKIVLSVIIGICLYFIIQSVMIGIIFGFGMLNQDMSSLFNSTYETSENFETAVRSLLLVVNVVYALFNIGFYFIGKYVFNKGVNVD